VAGLPHIDARLLGPLELRVGSAAIRLGPRRQRALLARLLLDAGRTVPVGCLVDDLWGEDLPATAVKMVHVHVSRLRKVLPGGILVTRAPGYAADVSAGAVDIVRFEQLHEQGRAALAAGSAAKALRLLREALALWRGPALAEFDEPFAMVESRRFQELRLACTEDRIEAELALGGHASLVGELDALVAHHPLRERAQRQLMLALYRSGRQAQALAQYRSFRQTLTSELGIEPSSALRALEHSMLVQDRALDLAHVNEPRATPVHRRVIARWRATGYASTSTRLQPTVIISTSG
jgi:DNA-binding SARP family transcriptional activator